ASTSEPLKIAIANVKQHKHTNHSMKDAKQSQTESAVTRRSFLSTSTAVAGGALVGTLPVERFALGASPGATLRVALGGCGGRGSGAADQSLKAGGEGVKLVAMADAFKDRLDGSLKILKKDHDQHVDVPEDRQFIGLDAYKKAIALADLVILATPPGLRP